jgi:hypothetical protein
MVENYFQDLIHMGEMGMSSFTVNQDAIQKGEEKMTYKGLKYVVHETLEC